MKVGVALTLPIPVYRKEYVVMRPGCPSIPVDRKDIEGKLRTLMIIGAKRPEDACLPIISIGIALCREEERTNGIPGPALLPLIAQYRTSVSAWS